MDLQEDREDAAFREAVRAVVRADVPAEVRQRVLAFHRVTRDDYLCWQRSLNARGWGAPGWPVEHGGTGWTPRQRILFEEECAALGAPRQLPFGLSLVGPVIQAFGSPEQKARFLPRILSNDDWWCQGYSEPGAGSDLASLTTRAERRGDHYVVTGQKTWTSYAHWADWLFCLVRTGVEGRPQEGISFLLIDMTSPGIEVRPIRTLDGGHDVSDVFLDRVEVPVGMRIGEENKGWTYAKFLLGNERAHIAGIGMCKRLLAQANAVARSESRRGRLLIEDLRFRDRLAQFEMELLAHEWSLLRMIDGTATARSGLMASVLKIRSSQIQAGLCRLLMDAVGPYALPYDPLALEPGFDGFTAGPPCANPSSGAYFDMRKVAIYGGTNEVQKNIIGKTLLDL